MKPEYLTLVVRPKGFEPPACGLGNRRSILLSYGRVYSTGLTTEFKLDRPYQHPATTL